MNKQYLPLIFVLLCYLSVFSNTGRYRLIITDDPATTIMIGWEQESGTSPVVYYGTTDFGTAFGSYPNTKGVDRSVDHKGMENRFAKLSGLFANTSYYFVINDSEGTSQRFWFKTAPATNTTMSFIAGGDSRNNREPRQYANTLVSKIKPTAVFFGGDMTDDNSDGSWQEWFDDWQNTTSSDGRMIPIVPARGNHERNNEDIADLFNTPSSDVYYKITFGANLLSMYTLNSEITVSGTQTSWLTTEVENDDAIWKSAQYHTPMRPHTSSKAENLDQISSWSQLFYDNGFRLVCESDSHTVKTTWPVKPCSSGTGCEESFIREDMAGTTYVGEGCWGAPLKPSDDNKTWTRDADSFNQFKHICVSETEIVIKTIKVIDPSSVGENSNSAVCTLPSGIDVWNPTNGSTTTINPFDFTDIELTNPNQTFYPDGTNLTINTNITAGTSTVDYVEFFIDDSSIGTDSSAPFTMTHTFSDGYHTVKAVVYDDLGLDSEDEFSFSVGVNTIVTSFAIIDGNDDVEEYEDDGEMYLGSSDLEMYNEEDGGRNSEDYMKVGLRFQNVSIPQGATVTSSYIQFTAEEDDKNFIIEIAGEDEDDSAIFEDVDNNLSNRTLTSTEVSWVNPEGWTTGESGTDEQTPDLSGIVNEIIGRAGWESGNALTLVLYGNDSSETNTRVSETSDSSSSPAELIVNYSVGTGPTQSLSIEISDDDDDVEEYEDTGEMYLDSSDLEMCYDSNNGNMKVGLRFRNVTIPQGAIVSSSYVQFTADETDDDVPENADLVIKIAGEDVDNSAVFLDGTANKNNLSNRNLTTEIVSWGPNGWTSGNSGSEEKTKDLSGILNEIVERVDWESGNAMTFVLYGENTSETSERTAESYEGGGGPAELHVTFTIPGAPLSVDDFHKNQIEIEVYPNPFIDVFTILLPKEYQNNAYLEVFSLQGQMIYYQKVANESIYLPGLSSGVYILRILGENGTFLASKRLFKK